MTGHWRKPLDFSEGTMAQAAAQVESFRNVFRSPSEPVGEWEPFEAALEDDFNTPEALAVMHGWRDHELLRRGLDVFGLASLAERRSAPAAVRALAEERAAARREKQWTRADELRDDIAGRGWDVRDVGDGFELVPRP
jgi:cysteinyl-tRNA synthetase